MKYILYLLCCCSLALIATADDVGYFDEAKIAASKGRYNEVVSVLSMAIEEASMDSQDLAIAHSNRGIAYSLLKQYPPAVEDLLAAIRLDAGHLLSINHLGILAEHIELNPTKAASWYQRAADAGYPASQVNLGNLYRDGRGGLAKPQAAVDLYHAAVAQGYAVAYVALGEMLLGNRGVTADYPQALLLLQQGVEQGVVTGHYSLGLAYEYGWGVSKDSKRAAKEYETAANAGHAAAQSALGYLYRRGKGVAKDFLVAAKWYRLAAEQGDVSAANRLAWLLATCPVVELCNGAAGLEFAQLATGVERSASNLDSLAAAHARTGDFEQALVVMNEILQDKNLNPNLIQKYARRLERYQQGIPYQL